MASDGTWWTNVRVESFNDETADLACAECGQTFMEKTYQPDTTAVIPAKDLVLAISIHQYECSGERRANDGH